jgi:hypothetical protein
VGGMEEVDTSRVLLTGRRVPVWMQRRSGSSWVGDHEECVFATLPVHIILI